MRWAREAATKDSSASTTDKTLEAWLVPDMPYIESMGGCINVRSEPRIAAETQVR